MRRGRRRRRLCARAAETGVSGATRWLHPEKALIQLSLRYKTNEFTFFHEAGHILLHGKKALFLEAANGAGVNGMETGKEAEADAFAERELISRRAFKAFTARANFSKAAIRDFARAQGIAPGIVAGQLQHKGLLQPSHCNDLKVRYQWSDDKLARPTRRESRRVKLTQQQLEAHLWGAADILRGKSAGQDYKNYILSLMFLSGAEASPPPRTQPSCEISRTAPRAALVVIAA
jgi:hypothetical protein